MIPLPQRPDGIFVIRPPGSSGLRELLLAIEERDRNLQTVPTGRLLIDMRGHSRILGDTENVILSHHLGQHLRGLHVAILTDTKTGHGQRVARMLGLDLRAFQDEDEAVEWLLKEA